MSKISSKIAVYSFVMLTRNSVGELFEYDDYRAFLRDWFESKRSSSHQFSYRYLSLKTGLKSTNYWKLVMDGDRNLSEAMIPRFAQTLKLNQVETQYFHHLVRMNQANSLQERSLHASLLLNARKSKKLKEIDSPGALLYTKWYLIALKELVSLEAFEESPEWVCEALYHSINKNEAREGLKYLEDNDFIFRDDKGRLHPRERVLSSGDRTHHTLAAQHLKQMIQQSADALEFFSADEREFAGMTLSLDKESAEKAKQLIRHFRKELMKVAQEAQNEDRLYQVNFQLYPLSQICSGPATTKERGQSPSLTRYETISCSDYEGDFEDFEAPQTLYNFWRNNHFFN